VSIDPPAKAWLKPGVIQIQPFQVVSTKYDKVGLNVNENENEERMHAKSNRLP